MFCGHFFIIIIKIAVISIIIIISTVVTIIGTLFRLTRNAVMGVPAGTKLLTYWEYCSFVHHLFKIYEKNIFEKFIKKPSWLQMKFSFSWMTFTQSIIKFIHLEFCSFASKTGITVVFIGYWKYTPVLFIQCIN